MTLPINQIEQLILRPGQHMQNAIALVNGRPVIPSGMLNTGVPTHMERSQRQQRALSPNGHDIQAEKPLHAFALTTGDSL